MSQPNRTAAFWAQVRKTRFCWEWIGPSDHHFGYGRFTFEQVRVSTHRYSYELAHGPIAKGLCVCHRCDNPKCVRPAHLFVGSKSDNNKDAASKRRLPHGSSHHNAKLTEENVAFIRANYVRGGKGGMTQVALAKMFAVSQPLIGYIVRGESWIHER